MFSDAQESDLGDIMAERFAADFHILQNDALAAHLREIGNRLIRYLPPNQFRFQFFLIEFPSVNAFSISGGRVYVARKMIALAKSDDEVAGVLAHELGHIVTHQTGIEMTTYFREVLGVTEVGDRNDIREKYFHLLESSGRKSSRKDTEDEDQVIADQVAVYAMARAGYAPRAYVEVWDRFQQTHGKTGNWLSDFFGSTKPSQKRLREMLKNVGTMPRGCSDILPTSDADAFAKWQAAVLAFNAGSLEASLPGLVFRQKLALPLRPDLDNLRFSPDGHYVLAQDDGGIHVLTRDPLVVLFFVDAPNAEKAFFSPDSRSVIFYTSALRIEIWDIATKQRTSLHEMTLNQGCLDTLLSPEGAHLACLREDSSVALFDVATGETIVEKKGFFEITNYRIASLVFALGRNIANMAFSPDGRYFLAGTRRQDLCYDFEQKRAIGLSGGVRGIMDVNYTFLGPDRIVGIDADSPHKSPVLQFPSGRRLMELPLNTSVHLHSPAHGEYLLVGPLKDHPMGIMDLGKRELIAEFQHNAGDIFDNFVITERKDGQVALLDVALKKEVGSVQLESSRLGRLTAASVSADMQWLAASSRSRGAMWNLNTNLRMFHTRAFSGAWFADDNALYADYGKFDKDERKIVRVDLSATGGFTEVYPLENLFAQMRGPYLLVENPEGKTYERKDWTMEIRDYRASKTVWTRHFPREVPWIFIGSQNTALLAWPLYEGAGREELQHYPDLKDKADKEDLLLEWLDFKSDKMVGKLLVKTNKSPSMIEGVRFDQNWVAVMLKGDRVLLYSLANGEEKGHFFGYDANVSAAAGVIAVTNSTGQLQLYDLATGQPRQQYQFPTAVAFAAFSQDGHRLFAFTRDQTAYILDINAAH
jgi:WD40 repeat protein